jgi:amino-acid N-acetyltransferase
MSDNNQNLVHFFREAAPYIHMHRGKTFVISLSGEVLQQPNISELLSDIALLSTLGAKIILVHGARPQIEAQLKAHHHEDRLHNNIRVTDDKTLELSKAAIGATRLEIENHLNQSLSRPPIVNDGLGIVSGNFLTAKPIGVIDGVDYQHTGKVRKIKKKLIRLLLSQNNIIILSPLGYSPTGQMFNLLYQEVAAITASKLNADKLIFMQNNDEIKKLPKRINFKNIKKIINKDNESIFNEINIGMSEGIERTHLIDTSTRGAILLELYTRDGIGSMIDKGYYDEPREANINDIRGILDLIRPLEKTGVLKKRTKEELELNVDKFSIIERDGKIIGCASLDIIENTDAAEMACLAVNKDYRTGNRGQQLLDHIINKGINNGINKLFVLTTQSIDWFMERDFKPSTLDDLPSTKKVQYNKQRNSKVLIRDLGKNN